ncbi:hypothetical protein HWV62_10855 [Athelia sp. TMB]|nr:hypothetical protein HWV62_10855 [Athelia sp. TMB]
MLPHLRSALCLLLSFAFLLDARAISTDTSSTLSAGTTPSFVSNTDSTSDGRCNSLDGCRSLYSIVQSCIATILACVWFAVHRNIPAPRVNAPQYDNLFVKICMFIRAKVLDQRQAATVFLVTLLVPEWVLAWALRQFWKARALSGELEEARIKLSRSREAEKHANETTDGLMDCELPDESTRMSAHLSRDRLVKRQVASQENSAGRRCKGQCEECGLHPSADDVREAEYDQVAVALRVAKADETWKIAHAFFVIMGGYYFYNKDGPRHPLSPKMVVELVRRGHLVAPTSDELVNQSNGDALSKGVAILQTLWFIMQCIARHTNHLPLTSLEVMTLAYTVITLAMYIVWWDKPLNVSCAVRVPEEQVEGIEANQYNSAWEQIGIYVTGLQDDYVDLRQCTRVPTFWAGKPNDEVMFADIIVLLLAMVFGAVHCIAWFDSSQSHLEQQVWRASAIAIITAPAALVLAVCLAFLLAFLLDKVLSVSEDLIVIVIGSLWVLLASVYAAARLALIVVSFTSLSMLPVAAYQTVQWTTFVPHI